MFCCSGRVDQEAVEGGYERAADSHTGLQPGVDQPGCHTVYLPCDVLDLLYCPSVVCGCSRILTDDSWMTM